MFYPKQKAILQHLTEAESLFQRREIDLATIHRLKPLIEKFEIRIPFIGQFSSGKSSLINKILQENLLSTEITPETAFPAEVRYGQTLKFTGHLENGQTQTLSQQQVEDNQLELLHPKGWLAVEHPSPLLAQIPQLVLVDLPGWQSGVAAHHQVIDNYVNRSLAYAVVVSVEEGTLRESLRQALLELKLQEKPVVLVITKAHKRTPEDVEQIKTQLTQEITNLMQQEPLAVAVTSAHKNDIQELQAALLNLQQQQAEAVFNNSIASQWQEQLTHAKRLLELLCTAEFKDAEAITAEIKALELKMDQFAVQLDKETQHLEATTAPMLSSIRMQVEQALHNRIENLTDHALNGGNVGNDILGIARMTVTQAINNDFKPSLQRYLGRLSDALPNSLDFELNLNLDQQIGTEGSSAFRWTDLSVALVPFLARFTGPIGMVVGSLIPVLARLFDSGADRGRAEAAEARQRERIKSQIRDAIANAVQQIEQELQPVMLEQIQTIKQSIEQTINANRKDIEKTLAAKHDALQAGEAEAAAQREAAQQDLNLVNQWLNQLA